MEDRDKDAVELINEAQDVVDKEDGDSEYSGRLLHQAAIYDNSELTQSLLEGVEREHVDAQDSFGRTALYTAVTNNSFECANLLLQAGGEYETTVVLENILISALLLSFIVDMSWQYQ